MPKYKTLALSLLCLCALAVAPTAWPARAQSNSIKVSVPFDFLVDGERISSGNYYISHALSSSSQGLRIWSADGDVNRRVATSRAISERPHSVRVVFNVYGDRHFLSQVFWPGKVNGFQLSKCQAELELEETARRDKSAPQRRRVIVSE